MLYRNLVISMKSNVKAKLYFRVKHSLPGRLRVAFPSLISHKRLIQCMKMYLSEVCGVARVITNIYSGSITIYYDSKITEEKALFDILDNVSWEKLFKLEAQPPKGKKEKGGWKLAGKFFGGVGILGIFIPLLPAFPLLLLAAFCEEKADGSTT